MGYRWKPSKSQRLAFADRMQDPDEQQAYENRKAERANRRRSKSVFDYKKAGGSYVPTKEQHDFCLRNASLFLTPTEINAMNQVVYGFSCAEKVHHDYIHIVNEKRRSKINSHEHLQ